MGTGLSNLTEPLTGVTAYRGRYEKNKRPTNIGALLRPSREDGFGPLFLYDPSSTKVAFDIQDLLDQIGTNSHPSVLHVTASTTFERRAWISEACRAHDERSCVQGRTEHAHSCPRNQARRGRCGNRVPDSLISFPASSAAGRTGPMSKCEISKCRGIYVCSCMRTAHQA